MQPTKLYQLYLEAYFVQTGIRIAKLEDMPEAFYLFYSEIESDMLATPIILHYRRKGWSQRRIASYLDITVAKVKVRLKVHGL